MTAVCLIKRGADMKNSNSLMIANIVIACFNWLVALPVLLCNLFGLWEWWHVSAYAYIAIFALPLLVAVVVAAVSIVVSYKQHAKKQLKFNIICLATSIAAVLFTFLFSMTWIW